MRRRAPGIAPCPTLSLERAGRAAVTAQQLSQPRATSISGVIEHLAWLQVDPASAVARPEEGLTVAAAEQEHEALQIVTHLGGAAGTRRAMVRSSVPSCPRTAISGPSMRRVTRCPASCKPTPVALGCHAKRAVPPMPGHDEL